ncbi:hypothetical protein WN55_06202 [Dufourea novaeangliae]|uniref:Uncharacterized protein n=1 Tax=Dufourea novaeangliae TaxID=178035 RepID=A0A154PPT6_DUFNO|nr:hypothetical protein WN55_06202 [Dufourea novaeangliae]
MTTSIPTSYGPQFLNMQPASMHRIEYRMESMPLFIHDEHFFSYFFALKNNDILNLTIDLHMFL